MSNVASPAEPSPAPLRTAPTMAPLPPKQLYLDPRTAFSRGTRQLRSCRVFSAHLVYKISDPSEYDRLASVAPLQVLSRLRCTWRRHSWPRSHFQSSKIFLKDPTLDPVQGLVICANATHAEDLSKLAHSSDWMKPALTGCDEYNRFLASTPTKPGLPLYVDLFPHFVKRNGRRVMPIIMFETNQTQPGPSEARNNITAPPGPSVSLSGSAVLAPDGVHTPSGPSTVSKFQHSQSLADQIRADTLSNFQTGFRRLQSQRQCQSRTSIYYTSGSICKANGSTRHPSTQSAQDINQSF